MRKITEFKGYRSFTDYDTATGQFFSQRLPDPEFRPEPVIEVVAGPPIAPLPKTISPKASVHGQRHGELRSRQESCDVQPRSL